ncbi:DUF1934 domain-containing protein [Paenibacillus sp. JX-17]|uniref:DUF1934 domain-containing protein n=1 Tax=Paenibacillus lacisoli TaxID=3064525 RepID=A0ABT9CHD0_9BACL|nr:DUF1934 domain-containing protein [Paenibacillus sp. JX-17]MDO7908676.1 DUF1934 domain-containing protein [Paenibacillus sp. JX-17]
MSTMKPVTVRLKSRQDGEQVIQELPGEATIRGSQLYVRYEEPNSGPEGGATRTTVKIGEQELKIIRHGEVQSEQSFELGRRLPGFYRSPYTSFALSTHTTKLEVHRDGLNGKVEWTYDLYAFEQLSGHFAISLHIQEETKS